MWYKVTKVGRIITAVSNTMRHSIAGFNPQTPKVFRQPKTPKGGGGVDATPPWIFAFPSEFLKIFLMGMFSGSRNPTVIMKKFYLHCMTLKIKVKHLFA